MVGNREGSSAGRGSSRVAGDGGGRDPLEGLNAEQRAAAEAVRGPVCILAGAGTGKTRTVTHRIAHQVGTGVARADQVLAVTFTEKAATELRHRLAALGVPPVRAATFHAAAWAQLRYFLPRATGERVPEVLASKLRLLVPVARRLGVEGRDLASEIEWAKARVLTPDDYATAGAERDAPLPPAQMAEVYADYEAAKADAGLIDYEDMLLRTAALIAAHPDVAEEVRARYRFLTVDEYQDVNPAQHALLRAWLGDGDDLCVVGDDDQTIYSFTGATSAYLTGFARDHPGARVVALRVNYRSTGAVLQLANRVLWTKTGRRRGLVPADAADSGPDPVFVEYPDGDDEVAGVVGACGKLIADGVPPGQIAVLYRVNAQSEALEAGFRAAGIALTVRGDEGFFGRPEVRQALRVLVAAKGRPEDPEELPQGLEMLAKPVAKQVEDALRRARLYDAREPSGAVARERWRNVGALVDAAARRAEAEDTVTFEAVVDDLVARATAGADAPTEDGAVTLATFHRAKGLEFDAVFLVSLEEGLLPISHARDDQAAIAEERRLLYVGVTRARRHLWLSWSRSRTGRTGRSQTRRPSRLLYGLGPGAPQAGAGTGATGTGRTDSAAKKPARDRTSPLSDLTGDDAALAGRLRSWRSDRAKRDEVPAYVVFSDRTLAALATGSPSSPRDLLAVPGLGQTKVDRYGDELLQILRAPPA